VALPLYDLTTLRNIESAGKAALPAGTLMQRAGNEAAALAWRSALCGFVRPLAAVFAGPGDNGGDAFVVAHALAQRGVQVRVFASEISKSADAQTARSQWAATGSILPLSDAASIEHAHCVVDGLLGIGIDKAPQGELADASRQINHLGTSGATVISLDVPSGLNAITGIAYRRDTTVVAHQTITFIGGKPGLYTAQGPDFCGQVYVAPLGLTAYSTNASLTELHDFAAALPTRRAAQHKGDSGDLLVIGGAAGMTGAALLAGRAALATGVGRLFVALEDSRVAVDPLRPEAMLRTWSDLPSGSAIVCGCGLSQNNAACDVLAYAVAQPLPVVLDADALNLLASNPEIQTIVRRRTAPIILTPHPLEAARLLNTDTPTIQSARLASARELAAKLNAHVVLKGAGSIIAHPQGQCFVNPTGNAALATGGTGDMLAGCLGALLCAGMPALPAALAATYVHGLAAQQAAKRLGGLSGITSDLLLQELTRLFNTLRNQHA
jgi:ADP-dependent NAD(P)H-hydrate dehydratase / NAD(P)H-hydrate epimerase